MEAPDKIYIHTKTNPPEITWSEVEEKNATNEEYIRKDALLEWAKEELSHAIANIDAYPYEDAFRGHREKIEELIDKLNSL